MSKTNLGLIDFCKSKLGVNYIYGAKGEILTKDRYDSLKKAYGKYVWDSDVNKVNTWCVDCSGLISWYTGIVRGSTNYYDRNKPQPISTIATAPLGVAVWHKGHIGVYIGNGQCIEAKGSAYGVVTSKISDCKFTHWFEIDDVKYIKEQPTITPTVTTSVKVEKSKIKVNGLLHEVDMIRHEDFTYIKSRDISDKLGFYISSEGGMPVFTTK